MSAVVLTPSPCALRFNITSTQTHESRRFVVVHNQIWKTNGLFCLPDGGSYDTDVTIHLNIPEPTINTKKWLTFNFSTVFTLRNVYTGSNTGLTTFTATTLKRPDLLKPPSLWVVNVKWIETRIIHNCITVPCPMLAHQTWQHHSHSHWTDVAAQPGCRCTA